MKLIGSFFIAILISLLSCKNKREGKDKIFLNISKKATVAFNDKSFEKFKDLTPDKKEWKSFLGKDTSKMKKQTLDMINSARMMFNAFVLFGERKLDLEYGKLEFENFIKYEKVSKSKDFYKVYFEVFNDQNSYKIGMLCIFVNEEARVLIPAWCSHEKCDKPYSISVPDNLK